MDSLLRAPQRTRYLVISGSGARSARDRLHNQSSRRMKLDSTPLLRGFFLESGYARPVVSLALRSPRQNRSISRSALRKNSPAASTASIANVRVSTAVTPVTDSSSCRSSPFKGLPFAAAILARHFPGVSSNAVISRPLYCIARPRHISAPTRGFNFLWGRLMLLRPTHLGGRHADDRSRRR